MASAAKLQDQQQMMKRLSSGFETARQHHDPAQLEAARRAARLREIARRVRNTTEYYYLIILYNATR